MATSEHTLSRRQALAGLSIVGAAAAVPAMGATVARSALAGTLVWDRAFGHWRAIQQKYDGLCDRFNAAEEAWGDASSRIDRFFEQYQLNTSMKRGYVEAQLKLYNTRARLTGGAKIDVQKVADEFDAYRKRSADLRAQFRVDEYWDQSAQYRPTYFEARDRIMQIPAPHVAALLVKIEIAAISLDNEHADLMLADAQRLLSNGRA